MKRLARVAVTLSVVIACGGNSNPAAPGASNPQPEFGPKPGTVTAFIDGVPYRGTIINASTTNGRLSVNAWETHQFDSPSIAFDAVAAVGTYSCCLLGSTASGMFRSGDAFWQANSSLGSGSVAVTTLTATGATGAFSFTMVPAGGAATGTKVISNGEFTVLF